MLDLTLNAALLVAAIASTVTLWVLISGAWTERTLWQKWAAWLTSVFVLASGGYASLLDLCLEAPLSPGGRIRTIAGVVALSGLTLYGSYLQLRHCRMCRRIHQRLATLGRPPLVTR